MIVDDPGGLGFEIQALWAFLAVHDDGDEGVIAAKIGGQWMPLVGADEARIESLRPYAMATAARTGKRVQLVRFDRRTLVETLGVDQ